MSQRAIVAGIVLHWSLFYLEIHGAFPSQLESTSFHFQVDEIAPKIEEPL